MFESVKCLLPSIIRSWGRDGPTEVDVLEGKLSSMPLISFVWRGSLHIHAILGHRQGVPPCSSAPVLSPVGRSQQILGLRAQSFQTVFPQPQYHIRGQLQAQVIITHASDPPAEIGVPHDPLWTSEGIPNPGPHLCF